MEGNTIMRIKDILIPVFSVVVLVFTGCLEINVSRNHPGHGAVGSSFTATTHVIFSQDASFENTNDDRAMLFAVHKPSGWTIDSVTYDSPEHGAGVFTYLGNATDTLENADGETGGIDSGWEDSLEAAHPADSAMHWQMFVSDKDTTSSGSADDPDTFHVHVHYTIGSDEGNHMLKYWTSHTNSNTAWDTGDNPTTANDGKPFTAYDPDESALVTFTVDDGSWLLEDVKFKGTMSDWNLFPGFDDGINGGDATAGDHIWTGQFAIIEDGDYEFGAIEDDGSAYGIYLPPAGNIAFTVSGTEVEGPTGFAIAPDSCATPNSVMFTVHDTNGDYVNGDLRWKGDPTSWALVQMYDDGTNGDEVAGDSIWTCIVPDVAAGSYSWGAVNWDGTTSGEWLIDPDRVGNPNFTLDTDNVTLHGETDYVIPERLFENMTRSVLFQADMTEWLDEAGSVGYRVFNVARDTVKLAGSFNGYGECVDCEMTRTPGTNIFSFAANVSGQPGSDHQYQFLLGFSEETIDSMKVRYGLGDTLAPVDYMGWGTSPVVQGNFEFNLGDTSEADNALVLPLKAYYDIYPGHVVTEGHEMDLEFTIDMSTHPDFDPAADNLFIKTHDKWLNYVQGFSDGESISHYTSEHNPDGPTQNEDGTFSMTLGIRGPQTWFIFYKWGYEDVSAGTEVEESGGAFGPPPRIRYIHRDAGDGCDWPEQFSFPTDGPFATTDDLIVYEPYDSSAICRVFASTEEFATSFPEQYHISNNYPNPFNPTTRMEFSLPVASDISFKVYNLIGVEVYSYTKSALSAGKYTLEWNGRNFRNAPVPSGVYIYEFRAGENFRQTKKMTLLK